MPIRLESPDSRLLLSDTSGKCSQRQILWKPHKTKYSLSTGARRVLICTALIWIIALFYCRHLFWRDPVSWFYSENDVYDFQYSRLRKNIADDFIARSYDIARQIDRESVSPTLCLGIVTVKRKQHVDYLNGTIGSMLTGLTAEERSLINLQLVFADSDPARHPEYNQTWLNVVDSWSSYNVSDEQFEQIKRWEKAGSIQEKGTYDYTYILECCLNNTNAPYIAIFEDDLVFAEGWLPKTLSALGQIREKSSDWLYLRLFYTEARLGWDKDVDDWYTHPILWLATCLIIFTTATFGVRISWKRIHPDSETSTLLVIGCIALPLFAMLLFMIGRNSLFPLAGLHRMDQKGCCTQALVYPRHHVSDLVNALREREPSQTDLVIDQWADEMGLPRYAISPQVVQHVGLISTRGMPKKYTRQTWAYYFEASDEQRLKREHENLARWGIWRATGQDYANVPH